MQIEEEIMMFGLSDDEIDSKEYILLTKSLVSNYKVRIGQGVYRVL